MACQSMQPAMSMRIPGSRANRPFFSVPAGIRRKPESSFFQAKLTVSQPGDPLEKEADAVAEAVLSRSNAANTVEQKSTGGLQRLCAECEKEEKKKAGIQKKESGSPVPQEGGGLPVASLLSGQIEQSAGKGSRLPQNTLAEMNSAFGVDFSAVNIHTGPEAEGLSRQLGALAFTHGNDIYFNAGRFQPDSLAGKRLLAHELTHVLQQGAMGPEMKMAQRQEAEDIPTAESPCEKASLRNEKEVPLGESGTEVRPCIWTMFKNSGPCSLTLTYTNQEGEITVEVLDPGAVTEAKPHRHCQAFKIRCTEECSSNGQIKWGPPCIV